jgi:hypothetical protein
MTENRKILLFCLFLTFTLSAQAQVRIIDATTNEPIPFVHIFTKDGILGAVSDLKGMITETDMIRLTDNKCAELTIQHIAYNSKQIMASELVRGGEIFLSARTMNLDEVIVTPQTHSLGYIGLKGFFRSYVLLNYEPKYYVDGIVTYYISEKQTKTKMSLQQYRVLRNEKLVAEEKKSFFIQINDRPGLPELTSKTLFGNLGNTYHMQPSESGYIIIHKDSAVGYVSCLPHTKRIMIHVDRMAPDSLKSFSLGRFKIQKRKWFSSAQYRSFDECNAGAEDLESLKEFYTTLYSFDKNKSSFEIQCLQELYIFDRSYLSESDMKTIKTTTKKQIPLGHQFKEEYWNNLKKYSIPDIDPNFGRRIGDSLIMY